jgi:hypothetical protein
MAHFLTELDCHLKSSCENIWILDSSLIYESDIVGRIVVPAGFETDLASVPRLIVIYELWGNRCHREAVIHDYLYRQDSVPQASKLQADRVFLEAMRVRGNPFYIRWFMFAGVAAFAWMSYHRKKVFP